MPLRGDVATTAWEPGVGGAREVRQPFSQQAQAYLRLLLGDGSWQSPEACAAAMHRYVRSYQHETRHGALMDLLEGRLVLDVGCDIGILTTAVATRAQHVLGIDVRPEAVEIAERMFAAPNVRYQVGDLSSLHLPESAFDCVLFLETVEHIEQPMTLLRELHRVLRPNGSLLLSTPNPVSFHEVLRHLVRLWPAWRRDRGLRRLMEQLADERPGSGTEQDHLYSWTWETLGRILWRSGFAYADHRWVGFGAPSVQLGSRRFWPLGRRELGWLKAIVGPFCQNHFLKLRAVKEQVVKL